MHWVKLLAEGWVLFGLVTVISGLFWTSKLNGEPPQQKATSTRHSAAMLNLKRVA